MTPGESSNEWYNYYCSNFYVFKFKMDFVQLISKGNSNYRHIWVNFLFLHFSYIADLKNVDDPEIQLSREFIIEHLLMIASYMDTADQASR